MWTLFFAESFPIFFWLLLLSFFSPFLFSLSSTLYPLSSHWKSFGLSPSKNLEMEHWSTRWFGLFYHQLCTQNWTRFSWYNSARIWSIFKMDTRMDGSVLAVLAAYQNNLVTSKMMTSQVVQWFPTLTLGKYNSWRETVYNFNNFQIKWKIAKSFEGTIYNQLYSPFNVNKLLFHFTSLS